MIINRNNYETYIVDYYDGTLATAVVDELRAFLAANPDLQSEFELYGEAFTEIPAESVRLDQDFKNQLKKIATKPVGDITKENIEEYLISETEGLLSSDERQSLDAFIINNPGYARDRKLYKLARVAPDKSVIYKNKPALRRPVPFRRKITPLFYWASAAAVGLFFISYVLIYNIPGDPTIDVQGIVATTGHEQPVTSPAIKAPADTMNMEPERNATVATVKQPIHQVLRRKQKNHVALPEPELVASVNKEYIEPVEIGLPNMPLIESQVAKVFDGVIPMISAPANMPGIIPESEPKSIRQYLVSNLNKLAEPTVTGGASLVAANAPHEKLNWWNFASLATNYIRSRTDKNVAIEKKEEDKTGTIALTIGGFEISRSYARY